MRKLAWFAGGFGAACLLSCYLSAGILPAVLCALLFVLSFSAALCVRPRSGESKNPLRLPKRRRQLFQVVRRSAALCLGAALAFLWFFCYTHVFCAPADDLADTENTISGTVSSYPEPTSIGGWSMTLRLDGDFRSPDVLLYGSEDWHGLKPGDHVTCTARLKSSEFLYGDETTYYTARGLFLLAYCNDPPVVVRSSGIPLRYWPDLCAKELKDGIYAAFDDLAAPLAAAVTLGDKDGLSDQLYSALNRSGIMHAAVVSGMHISLLVSALLLVCRGRRGPALCMVPVLFFYALMAGATPSAVRAVVMQTALLAGPVLNRENDAPTSLGLSLLILLIQNPYAAASVSLQMSFASVTGILMVTAPLYRAMAKPLQTRLKGSGFFSRALRGVCRTVFASLSASLGALLLNAPLVALYFGRIGLIAPLTNILILWAIAALMVCALVIGTLAIIFPTVMTVPGFAAGLLAHYINRVASFIGRWPLASLDTSSPYFMIWFLSVYLFLFTIVFSSRRWRQTLISLACLTVLLFSAAGLNRYSVRSADLSVTAIDVGQGASTLFLSGGGSVLVDCGGNASSSAGDLAADRLAALGQRTLDALVLTHLDDDHFNGVAQLFWRLKIHRVYVPESTTEPEHMEQLLLLADQEGAEVCFVNSLHTFSSGSAQFTLYPPLSAGTSNEEGLFVLCSCNEFDTLITGDADCLVERMLIKYYPIPDLELLLVGHHGSKYSSDPVFLDALRPELAIISSGYNSYGHPAPEVLDRLAHLGSKIYRTDQSGSVTVTVRGSAVSVRQS